MKRGFLTGKKAAKLTDGQRGKQDPGLETQKPTDEKKGNPAQPQTTPAEQPSTLKFINDASMGWILKYSQHTFIHHVVSTSAGTTDCLLSGPETKKFIPKYLSPVQNPVIQPYVIRPAGDPKRGLGMFATRDLQAGELILRERPIFLLPRLLDSVFVTGVPTFFPPQKNPANRAAWEAIFCPFFERISKEKQDEYRALTNSHPEDGIGPLLGTFRTNSFEHCLDGGSTMSPHSYSAVYTVMSRVNHSCVGNNSQSRFVAKLFAVEFRATRDIKKDDEIFVSYCGDKPGTTVDRQKFLGYYGFQCTCASCTSPVSDHLYLKILSSHQDLDRSYETWLKDLTLLDDHIIKPSLVWTSLIEQQGIPVMEIYLKHLEIIMRSFIALGDLENSVKNGMRLARVMLAMTGLEQLSDEYADPNYYLRNSNFGTRRRVGLRKGKGKGKGKGAQATSQA